MKFLNFSLLVTLLTITVFSCKKEKDSPADQSNPPKVTLINDVIVTNNNTEFTMEADLEDVAGLESFSFRYDDWFLYNTVSLNDLQNPKSYKVKYKFVMPDSAANKIHSITLTAKNIKGGTTSKQFKVTLNTDFPKMYLTETLDPTKLTSDLFGVPTLISKTGSFTFRAIYYSSAPNTNIWFLPSKTVAKPILYGIDPQNTAKLTGDARTAQPIKLPGVGYYTVDFNTLNLGYSVTALPTPPAAGAYPQIAIAGRGFTDFPSMNFQNALPNIVLLDKDPVNPYLFTKVVNLGVPAGQTYATAQFLLTTNNGWTNFWRFDARNPEAAVFGGGIEAEFPITSTPQGYKVTFDSYTNRAKFEKL